VAQQIGGLLTRTFSTGATRDNDDHKLDYEGFLSPLVLEAYANYMHPKRTMPGGTIRASDNWQKGIPLDAYMKSKWRHFMDVWKNHRGLPAQDDLKTALLADLFNTMGYLHEVLKAELPSLKEATPPAIPVLTGHMVLDYHDHPIQSGRTDRT
jgi:hypothetical protein